MSTLTGHAAAVMEAERRGAGPRTRVRLDGTGTEPQVRAALTRAWRLIGQPITVVVGPTADDTRRACHDWVAEHFLHGCGLDLYGEGQPVPTDCVVVPADRPAPYCGCVHPPCTRCLGGRP